MIKLTRTETIELPSWEEFISLYKMKYFYGRNYIQCVNCVDGDLLELYWKEYPFYFDFTEQGYQQCIEKIKEIGNFKETHDE